MNATPIKILIVDDEPPIRRLLRVGLATQGYTAIEATNGRAAIEHMQGNAQDLIILDLGLPEPVRME
jgi:two-component system, OmpR family, KDP operon response regulator KdpE